MTETGEPDFPGLDLIDSAVIPDAKSPAAPHATERLDIETGSGPRRVCGEEVEGIREASLYIPREAPELSFCAGLEEDFPGHGSSQPEPLPDLTPRDVRFLA